MVQATSGRVFIDAQFAPEQGVTAHTLTMITEISRRMESRGSHLILLPIPLVGLYYEEQLPKASPQLAGLDFAAARASYGRMVKQFREAGVSVIPLDDLVQQMKGQPSEFSYPDDLHWTSQAVLRSAERVAQFVKRTYPDEYAAEPKIQVQLSRGPVQAVSGFGDMIKATCNVQIGRSTFQPFTHKRTGGGGLLDDSAPSVALIGASFIKGRPDWGFESALANFLKLDTVNYGVPAGGMVASPDLFFSSLNETTPLPKFIVFAFYARPDAADGHILNQAAAALTPCQVVWQVKVPSGQTLVKAPRVQAGGYLKISDYSVNQNLTVTTEFKNGSPFVQSWQRFTPYWTLNGLKRFTVSLRGQPGDITQVKFSQPSTTPSVVTLCQGGTS